MPPSGQLGPLHREFLDRFVVAARDRAAWRHRPAMYRWVGVAAGGLALGAGLFFVATYGINPAGDSHAGAAVAASASVGPAVGEDVAPRAPVHAGDVKPGTPAAADDAGAVAISDAVVVRDADDATPLVTAPVQVAALENVPAIMDGITEIRRRLIPAATSRGPMIAIVMDDLGVDRRRSIRAMSLVGPMTMALLPYARDLDRMVMAARVLGHEILVHVPMEPLNGEMDPGPNVLQAALGADEILHRLRSTLDQFSGYVGISNHMGSKFTRNTDGMRTVMSELKQRGMVFVDSVTTAESVGARVAVELGVPHAVRDVFLDTDRAPENIRGRLAELERIAEKHGHAVGIAHPYDTTIAELHRWQYDVQARGFTLVPISIIARIRNGQAG